VPTISKGTVATGLTGEKEKQTREKKFKITRKTNFLITCDFQYAKIINFTIHTQLFLYKNGYYYSKSDNPAPTMVLACISGITNKILN
jgi:hypothetical protein